MKNLNTTVAAYPDLATAEKDWESLQSAAGSGELELADAALISVDQEGTVEVIQRESHHGWGKGAVAGGVIGLLFPPAIIAGAVVGGAGGGVISRLHRSLDRGDLKDLGEVMDSGAIALVAVTGDDAVTALDGVLVGASSKATKASSTAEEVQEAINADATG